jgi:hypothetical protein
MLKIFLVLSFLYCARALPNWTDLKVTWGINPFSSDIFVSVPRFEIDAIGLGWKLDKDCSQINGKRYILNNDRAVMLVFGANRYISGIATSFPKNLPLNFPSDQVKQILVDEGDYYSLTAYFVDPSTVCTNKEEPALIGGLVGLDRLVVKGTGLEISVPLNEKDIGKQGFWTKGYCFYTMGQHYWANIRGVPITEVITLSFLSDLKMLKILLRLCTGHECRRIFSYVFIVQQRLAKWIWMGIERRFEFNKIRTSRYVRHLPVHEPSSQVFFRPD